MITFFLEQNIRLVFGITLYIIDKHVNCGIADFIRSFEWRKLKNLIIPSYTHMCAKMLSKMSPNTSGENGYIALAAGLLKGMEEDGKLLSPRLNLVLTDEIFTDASEGS